TVISKQSVTGSKELKGCRLQILDKDKKVIVRWTSGDKDSVKFGSGLSSLGYQNMAPSFDGDGSLVVRGLFHDEKYILRETRPADGYVTADDIAFELTEREAGETAVAVYQGDEMVMQDGNRVVMVDDTTKIRLIKIGSDTGQGLRGARIEVLDSKGEKVMGFSTTEDGVDITGKLAVGKTYTFRETEAPKGYKLAKPVKYKIKDTGKLQKVTMTDEKTDKPHVPQTGRTTPLVASAALLLLAAAGSGTVFRKKRARR
ncbi:MAG: LPXTG cell wall anchor domain-containing protein, partial [Lachnospiraceae bacterium]|nr:LPXTG cell wall anchor domain-containing protein [Lachnospiraceae bacterium]